MVSLSGGGCSGQDDRRPTIHPARGRIYVPFRNPKPRGSVPGGQTTPSCDEVGLVDHACGSPAGDADEDPLVQPVELGGRGLDLG